MHKTKRIFIFMAMFLVTLPSYSLKYMLRPFRFNYYVYYEILYKVEGIDPREFSNVNVLEESTLRLVFEYNGQQYTAVILSRGAIYVDMPEGRSDRYLTRTAVPSLISSQYD